MIEYTNPEHFENTKKYAEKLGGKAEESFKHSWTVMTNILNNFSREKEHLLTVAPDFVPNSFSWSICSMDEHNQPAKMVYNGGMICHGQGVETFSVELCPQPGIHWSIHT